MNARCQEFRDHSTLQQGDGVGVSDEAAGHLAHCEACALWLARRSASVRLLTGLERRSAPAELDRRVAQALTAEARVERAVDALRALPRLAAPTELDGRVVAARHAGHREDRAVAWLRDGLEPQRAPAELEWRVAAELAKTRESVQAPSELGRRVAEDLNDLAGTLAARYAARLEPMPAPDTLEARVHEMLARVARRRRLALAAALVLGMSALGLAIWRDARDPAAERGPDLVRIEVPGVDFEVQLVQAAALHLSPVISAHAGGVTSGLSDVLLAAPQGSAASLGAWARESRSPSDAPRVPLGVARDERAPADHGATAADGAADGETYPSSGGDGASPTPGSFAAQPFLEKLVDAPFAVAHSGRRRVVVRDPLTASSLELVEGVWSDGAGRFAVRLLEGGPDDAMFELMHNDREGFIQRYRDFRVRDLASFLESFEVDVLDEETKIAGRRVVRLEIVRRSEPDRRYTVAVDPLTGLVLGYQERQGAQAELVAALEYETLDLDPDLDEIELTGGPTAWLEFDVDDAPRALAGSLRRPLYVPRHHHFERAASIQDVLGRTWVEFVFGDGVEQVFFLHGEPHAPLPEAGPTGMQRGDSVRVSRIGAWTILAGEIRGTPVAALGKVDLGEILLLVQSAFGD